MNSFPPHDLFTDTLFIFSCFDAQLPQPHTYGDALVHMVPRSIVDEIVVIVGSGNNVKFMT